MAIRQSACCPGVTRRSFLADTGMGFTGLALGAMLFKDGVARAGEPGYSDIGVWNWLVY